MEELFYAVAKMSLTGSWVILAVLLLRLLLKKAPRKYSYALWAVAAFRLLCPVTFQSALSLFRLRLGPEAAPVVNLSAVTGAEYNFVRPQLSTGVPAMNAVVGGSFAPSEPNYAASANPEQIWLFIGMVLWCAGVAAMLLYAAGSYLRLRLRLRDAVMLEKGVWQTERVSTPFLLGLFRPRIYVPYGLTEQELTHILAHERAHIRRLDHLVKPLAFLILTLHWFNPLVWLAFLLLCRDMELSCDEAVLRRHGDIRREYSQTLLNVAASRRFPSPSPLAFGEGDVKCRIRSALRWKKPKIWVTVIALVLCAAAVVVCAADPKEEDEFYPFSEVYRAEEVVYQCPMLSMLYRPETLPEVTLSSDQGMFLREPYGQQQTYAGVLTSAKLTKEEFEALFLNPLQEIGEKLRKRNKNVWQLNGEEQWYLLEQKTGELYLARCLSIGNHDTTARWVARLTPANQIWASTDGHSHYDLARCFPEQEIDFAALPVVNAGERTVLEFHLNWECPSLIVAEEYYEYGENGVQIHGSETTLVPGDDGVFRLLAVQREGYSQDYALYSVQDGDTRHVLRVNFSGTVTRPVFDHETPDPDRTEQLQDAWSEARLRTAFAETETYRDCEILDVVAAVDGAGDLAGVVQYREKGQEGCFAFVPKNGAIHPVTLPDMLDQPDAMVYTGDGQVQLQLQSTVHETIYLYVIRFSRTEERVHIEAESDVILTPVDHAVQSVLKAVLRSGEEPTGLVSARSYAIVNSQDQSDGSTRVCVWLMYRDYSVWGGGLTPVNTRYGPAVLVFSKEWDLTDVQMLTDSHAPGDVQSFFGDMAALVLQDAHYDAETYRLPLQQACYDQALTYAGMQPETLAAEAFAAILSGAKSGDDAKALLAAHPVEYDRLLQLGDHALRHIFTRFLSDAVGEPEGKVLQRVMDALVGGEVLKTNTETGQAYFDTWREHAQRIHALNGDEFMETNAPKSWLLLQMLSGEAGIPAAAAG